MTQNGLKLYKMVQNGFLSLRQKQKLPVKITGMTGPSLGKALYKYQFNPEVWTFKLKLEFKFSLNLSF